MSFLNKQLTKVINQAKLEELKCDDQNKLFIEFIEHCDSNCDVNSMVQSQLKVSFFVAPFMVDEQKFFQKEDKFPPCLTIVSASEKIMRFVNHRRGNFNLAVLNCSNG